MTASYESLPKIAKIIIQIIFGALVGGIYRIIRYTEKKNTTTLVAGILSLIPPICVAAWICDLVTEITDNRIKIYAD